jgi:hypothetical protein
MPIQKTGWELLITRLREDSRNGKRRTVGRYQVWHEGTMVEGLSGMCAETLNLPDPESVVQSRLLALVDHLYHIQEK